MFNYPHLDYFFKSIRKGFEFLILSNQENLDGEWIHLCYKKNCHFCSNDVTIMAPISAITSSMPKVATRQDYNFVPYARK